MTIELLLAVVALVVSALSLTITIKIVTTVNRVLDRIEALETPIDDDTDGVIKINRDLHRVLNQNIAPRIKGRNQ